MTDQEAASARVAERRDRLKGASHITKLYKDHYTIDYNVKPIILKNRDAYTYGFGKWWLTKNGRAI